MAKVKGVALLSRLAVIKEKYGVESLNSVLGNMKPQHREVLGNAIPSTWYDGEIYVDFNRAIQKTLGRKDHDIMEHIGEMSAEAGLLGIYSSRLKVGDVRQTLTRAPVLWKSFHDTGEPIVELDPDRNQAVFRIADYELPHPESFKNLVGWVRRMVELSGGKNASVAERKCICRGDDCCEMFATWD
jgi:hypothetical protein